MWKIWSRSFSHTNVNTVAKHRVRVQLDKAEVCPRNLLNVRSPRSTLTQLHSSRMYSPLSVVKPISKVVLQIYTWDAQALATESEAAANKGELSIESQFQICFFQYLYLKLLKDK